MRIDVDQASGTVFIEERALDALPLDSRMHFRNALGFRVSTKEGLLERAGPFPGPIIERVLVELKRTGSTIELTARAKAALRYHVEERKLRERAVDTTVPLPVEPRDLPNRKLFDYQLRAARDLIRMGHGANFSVPGSGKTTITYSVLEAWRQHGLIDLLVVVAPRSAFVPWQEEFLACYGRNPNVLILDKPEPVRETELANLGETELIILTYQMLPRAVSSIVLGTKDRRVMVVFDESHYIKQGPGGVWWEAALELTKSSKRRMVLTGTPAPQSLYDLDAQFEILWPGQNPAKKAINQFGVDRLSDIRNALAPYYTRIRKHELNIPEAKRREEHVELSPHQKRIYHAIATHTLEGLQPRDGESPVARAMRKNRILRLLQALSNPGLLQAADQAFQLPPMRVGDIELDQLVARYPEYEVPERLTRCVKLAQKLARKDKVVIWTNFVANVERIGELLRGSRYDYRIVHGGINKEGVDNERDEAIRSFKEEKNVRILIATTPSISESISLHRVCHQAIYLDRTFNAAHYLQSMDRIHRIGLTPSDGLVIYHFMRTPGTLDDVVETRLADKVKRMNRLLDDDLYVLDLQNMDEPWLANHETDWSGLTDEDIDYVFKHLQEQVGRGS